MSRFHFPERFFRRQDRDSLLAFFTVVDTETGLEYSNWRLINGVHGPFVGSPSEKYESKDKGTQYAPYVRPAYDTKQESKRNPKGDAWMQELTTAAYAFYDASGGGSKPAPSGRGPVAEEEDDGLPF